MGKNECKLFSSLHMLHLSRQLTFIKFSRHYKSIPTIGNYRVLLHKYVDFLNFLPMPFLLLPDRHYLYEYILQFFLSSSIFMMGFMFRWLQISPCFIFWYERKKLIGSFSGVWVLRCRNQITSHEVSNLKCYNIMYNILLDL